VPTATPTIATSDTFRPVAGAVFGDPTAAHNKILDALLANIAHTPKGATIQIVGYSFSLMRVADALLAAYHRGVHVQVVVNSHSKQWGPAKTLVPALGSDPRRSSFFVLAHGSARGTGGVTHEKAWTFSQVGQTPDVVMIGSTNLTGYGTSVQFSDNYTYVNRPDVYGDYAAMFAVQKLDQPVSKPFVVDDFVKGEAYFFPKPGTTESTDPVVSRINALPSGPGTTIRVSQFSWWDARGRWIAKTLAAKADTGTHVQVVAGESVGSGIKDTLRAHHIPVHSAVYSDGKRIHTKLMLADWTDATGQPHESIWTGSDNWADQSLSNEETMLRVDDDPVAYAAYLKFFDMLAARR
jgi:phosphatidylserine/phosphatidylglycerophosphate/cardiolipin synthase-like enzyme